MAGVEYATAGGRGAGGGGAGGGIVIGGRTRAIGAGGATASSVGSGPVTVVVSGSYSASANAEPVPHATKMHTTTIRRRPVKDCVFSGRSRHPPTAAYTGRVARQGEKLIVDNRRARHDYHLLERVEAGLVLTGTEVKSLRDGRASLQQAYADVRDGEAWLVGAHISVYDQGNIANHDPDRDRKLLLHKKELASLAGKVAQRGLTLVPTKLYFKDGRAKVELALARGKEVRDRRRDIAKREADRDIQRTLKSRHRGLA